MAFKFVHLCILLAHIFLRSQGTTVDPSASKPNVLVILIDDMGYGDHDGDYDDEGNWISGLNNDEPEQEPEEEYTGDADDANDEPEQEPDEPDEAPESDYEAEENDEPEMEPEEEEEEEIVPPSDSHDHDHHGPAPTRAAPRVPGAPPAAAAAVVATSSDDPEEVGGDEEDHYDRFRQGQLYGERKSVSKRKSRNLLL